LLPLQIKGQLETWPGPAAQRRQVLAIWEARWKMLDSPLHGAAYCMDPEFMNDDGLDGDNAGDACVQDLLTMMKRLIPDDQKRAAARASYKAFRAKEGLFGTAEAQEDAACTPAHQWWDFYGRGHPELSRLAVRVLSQVTSACSCERNWSAYDFIHSSRRNKLAPERARDLVYVFSNRRLVRKMCRAEGEAFIPWDEEEQQDAA
jgi:hAT family C-terminal dimerisation region